MGALVADIAAAFVLLVAGGCARVLGRHAWFWLGEIWRAHVEAAANHYAVKPPGDEYSWKRIRDDYIEVGREMDSDEAMDALERDDVVGVAIKQDVTYEEADAAQLKQKMYGEHVGTKNAGKVPTIETTRVFGKPCPEFDEERLIAEEEAQQAREKQRRLRNIEKWERRLEQVSEELTRARLGDDERTRKWAQMKGCGAL